MTHRLAPSSSRFVAVLLVAAAGALGCSSGDRSTHREVRMEGQLASGPAVTHVAAIPVVHGVVEVWRSTETPVAADGSFEVPVTVARGESFVLLLVNEGATSREGRAVGFAALRSSGGAELTLLPPATRELARNLWLDQAWEANAVNVAVEPVRHDAPRVLAGALKT
jgi:hypothetical protein